jgi:hypothetical protein
MKRTIFLFFIFGLTLLSCKKTNLVNCASGSLEGKWRMIVVKENTSGLITTKPSSIAGNVDITFSSNSSTGGVFTGNTPTNTIGENVYSTGTNHSLGIPGLSMTKVMETPWGKEFVDNIRSSRQYSFEIGGNLNIKTSNKTLTFRKL